MISKSHDISTNPVKVLKLTNDIFLPVLSLNFNRSLSSGTVPSRFKKAKIVPIHNVNLKTDANNYRPRSVFPLLRKIFEREIHNQVYKLIVKNNLSSKSHVGFRTGKSTTLAIVDRLEYIYKNLSEEDQKISIILDFRNASTCIELELLLEMLSYLCIRRVTLQWFRSYLSNLYFRYLC